jgi:uncharacterized protein with HEPN domain
MSKRDYSLLFQDILDSINKILKYTKDLTYDQLAENDLVIDAVVRNFEIIGEAIKNIPEKILSEYNSIPWNKIVGFRNIVIHKYFDVDLENIWKIIMDDLAGLRTAIDEILTELKGQELE